jgi:hypothetical protein
MAHVCSIRLRPAAWSQSVEHFANIKVEGRRFIVDCVVERSFDLRLSNRMKIRDLPVQIQIFETTRMQDQLAKLPEGSIGSFSFSDAIPSDIDFDGMDPHLLGWFVLNAQSFEDAWVQVLRGGYNACSLTLWIGPTDDTGPGFLWDVEKNPHLNIDTLQLSFSRPGPPPADQSRK